MYNAAAEKLEEAVENISELLQVGPHASGPHGKDPRISGPRNDPAYQYGVERQGRLEDGAPGEISTVRIDPTETGGMIRGATLAAAEPDLQRPGTPDLSYRGQPILDGVDVQYAEKDAVPGSSQSEPEQDRRRVQQSEPTTSGTVPQNDGEFAQQEKASHHGWLAELLEYLWMPQLMTACNKIAWSTLPDLLHKSKPGWMSDIQLKKFELGHVPPVLSNIKPWKDASRIGDEQVGMDCDVLWESHQDIELEVYPFPRPLASILPDFLEDALSKLVSFSCGVEKLKLKGKLRLTFDPLVDRMPVVGAIKVAFREQPEFLDFDVSMMSSSKLEALLPSLKAYLVTFVRDSLISSYLMPEHYTLVVDDTVKDIEVPEGLLVVNVIEARNVPAADYFTHADPYVELKVRETQQRLTSIKYKTHSPKWNERFEFPIHMRDAQKLTAILKDHDVYLSDEQLGRVSVPLKELQPNQKEDLWLETHKPGEDVKEAQRESQRSVTQQAKHAAQKARKPWSLFSSDKDKQPTMLHLQLEYCPFTDEEMKAICEAQAKDNPQILARMPRLARLSEQGVVTIHIIAVRDLAPQPMWRGRHRKLQVYARLGTSDKKTTVYKGNRRGANIDETLQLEVTGDADKDQRQDTIAIKVVDTKFFNTTQGTVEIPLSQLKKAGRIKRPFKLDTGVVDLDLTWKSVI